MTTLPNLPYSKDEIDKIGNVIIYLAQNTKFLSKTKLLKLLYLLEESSVKLYGAPFLNLRFEVWQFGPVSKDIFVETTSNPSLLKDYIKITYNQEGSTTFIEPIKEFSDDEFSDNDIRLMEIVLSAYGEANAEDLVNLLHREHSLWYQTAREAGVLESLLNKSRTTTDIEIDFTDLLKDDQSKKSFYLDQIDFLSHSKHMKL